MRRRRPASWFAGLGEPDEGASNEQQGTDDEEGVIVCHNIGFAADQIGHRAERLLLSGDGVVTIRDEALSHGVELLQGGR